VCCIERSNKCGQQSEGIVAAELHSVEEWRSEFVGTLLWEMEAGQCPERMESAKGAPSTRAIGPNGNPLWREMACWKVTGNQLTML